MRRISVQVRLADREADIMDVLWEAGPSTVAEVRDRLAAPLAYTTVLTILRNLEAKGYVDHVAAGRAHRYRALVSRDLVRRRALRKVSEKFFKGSYALLFSHLMEDEELSEAELREIRKLLDEKKKRRGRA